jgi:UDP-N-acetylglucosamine diphosphorylase/glucosamine-1-phosphate N-acetyltransferase
MVDSICIFEGIYFTRLLPLVYFRPQYDLRCGILTLREKVEKRYPDIPISLHCRSYLKETVKQHNPDRKVNEIEGKKCLLVNGRAVFDDALKESIDLNAQDTLYVKGDQIVAAVVGGKKLDELKEGLNDLFTLSDFNDLVKVELKDANIATYPWDLVQQNGEQIEKDYALLVGDEKEKINGKIYDGVTIVNRDNVYIAEGAKVKPGVVLDAEEGPIYIDKKATIFPNAVVEGPAFVGESSKIKIGAKIYEGTSVGEVCKVGGEVEESIIHSYSNKQHDGFLGHAYLGQWCNLGADTNNSDLKNNYGSVKVYVNDEQIDSGSMFVGLTMGDHSKSGINTMFNTGTVVGVCSNVFGSGFPPKYVPSFAWGGSEAVTTYDMERALDVSRRVMARRDVDLTEHDEKLFRKVFDLTKDERKKRGFPN